MDKLWNNGGLKLLCVIVFPVCFAVSNPLPSLYATTNEHAAVIVSHSSKQEDHVLYIFMGRQHSRFGSPQVLNATPLLWIQIIGL